MSMTDPIADFCTRIRNGYAANKRWVDVPSSNLKKRLSLVLKEEGYIDNFVFVDKEDSKEDIRLYLRYNDNSPAITTIEKISKPGKRVYVLSLIHISEPTRLRHISYAVFCLKKIFF